MVVYSNIHTGKPPKLVFRELRALQRTQGLSYVEHLQWHQAKTPALQSKFQLIKSTSYCNQCDFKDKNTN